MFNWFLQRLTQEKQISLLNKFNKVALIGNAAVTGYIYGGPIVALSSASLLHFAPKHLRPLLTKNSQYTKLADTPGFISFLDKENGFYKHVTELKENMNIEDEIRVAIFEGLQEPRIMGDGPYCLCLPKSCEDIPLPHLLSLVAHELGHVINKDTEKTDLLRIGSNFSNGLNALVNGTASLATLNPLPIILQLTSLATNKVLRTNANKIQEYRSDMIAVQNSQEDVFLEINQKVFATTFNALRQAITKRGDFDSKPYAGHLKSLGLEELFVKLKDAYDSVATGDHPPFYKRVDRVIKSTQEKIPDIQIQDSEQQALEICTGCTSTETESEKRRLMTYLSPEFSRILGSTDIDIHFDNFCGHEQPAKIEPASQPKNSSHHAQPQPAN